MKTRDCCSENVDCCLENRVCDPCVTLAPLFRGDIEQAGDVKKLILGRIPTEAPKKEYVCLQEQLYNLDQRLTQIMEERKLEASDIKKRIEIQDQESRIAANKDRSLLLSKIKMEIQMEKDVLRRMKDIKKNIAKIDMQTKKFEKSIEAMTKKRRAAQNKINQKLDALMTKEGQARIKREQAEATLTTLDLLQKQKMLQRSLKQKQLLRLESTATEEPESPYVEVFEVPPPPLSCIDPNFYDPCVPEFAPPPIDPCLTRVPSNPRVARVPSNPCVARVPSNPCLTRVPSNPCFSRVPSNPSIPSNPYNACNDLSFLTNPCDPCMFGNPSFQSNPYNPYMPSNPSFQNNPCMPSNPSFQNNPCMPSNPSFQNNPCMPSNPSFQNNPCMGNQGIPENPYDACNRVFSAKGCELKQSNCSLNASSTNSPYVATFNLVKILATGTFTEVALVKSSLTNNKYIIKSIIKKDNISKVCRMKTVFAILTEHKHPFLVTMHDVIQDDNRVFFVMEFLCNGNLKEHLKRFTVLEECEVVFFAACALLGIDHLHSLDIAHRDIKLDNLVLDSCGYVKLVDFDLAIPYVTYNTPLYDKSGTSIYKAPEFFKPCEFTTRAADFWALGVVIHALLTAKCINTKPCLRLAEEKLSAVAEDLLVNMLHLVPAQRLGYCMNGGQMIMKHCFFKDIDWTALYQRRANPPKRFLNKFWKDYSDGEAQNNPRQ